MQAKCISVVLLLGALYSCCDYQDITFHSTSETLSKITEIIAKKEKGIYLRFGDGDVNLANGQGEMLQKANTRLTFEMQEAFGLQGINVLKCLFIHCKELGNYEEGMEPGNHESPLDWSLEQLKKARPYWQAKFTDIYSTFALHYIATREPIKAIEFLKFLKDSNCCLLVGNKNIPREIMELLFGSKCQFVPTPATGSYNEIDRIEKECLDKIPQDSEYKIIITAMGCSGRVLQKRLWKKLDNVFLFDFGSLMDALCGWNTRQWITTSKINMQEFTQMLCKEMNYELPENLMPKMLQRLYY